MHTIPPFQKKHWLGKFQFMKYSISQRYNTVNAEQLFRRTDNPIGGMMG